MRLAHPEGLALLGVALPVLLLYVLRQRRTPRKVASLTLFRRVERDLTAQRPWRKLLPELSLLLQLLLVVLLAVLAAAPEREGSLSSRASLGVVLDISASMASRRADGSTRLQRAAALVADLHAAHGDRLHLVLAGVEPRLVEADAVRMTLAELDAEDTGSDLEAAVALAEDRLRGDADAQLLVISDGETPRPRSRMALTTQNVGEPAINVALSGGKVHVNGEGRAELSALVTLHADAGVSQDVQVNLLALDGDGTPGATLDTRRLTLRAALRTPVRFSPANLAQGAYALQVSPGGALDRDDTQVVLVPAAARLPVVVVAEFQGARERHVLVRALLADRGVAVQAVTPEEYPRVDVPPDALELMVGQCPDGAGTLRPRGRDLVVFAPPPGRCFGATVEPLLREPRRVVGWRQHDARFRFLSLDDVHVDRASTLVPNGGDGALIEDRRGALAVDASTSARSVTVLGFTPEASNFPKQRNFVVWLRNLTELARQHRTQGSRQRIKAGGGQSVTVPSEVAVLRLRAPGLVDRKLDAHRGEVVLPPLPRAGLARLQWDDPSPMSLPISVQFADNSESVLRGNDEGSFDLTSAPGAPSRVLWTTERLRLLLALLALGLLAFELLLYGRRPSWLTWRRPLVPRRGQP